MTINITGKNSLVEQLLAEELTKKGFNVIQEAGDGKWGTSQGNKQKTVKLEDGSSATIKGYYVSKNGQPTAYGFCILHSSLDKAGPSVEKEDVFINKQEQKSALETLANQVKGSSVNGLEPFFRKSAKELLQKLGT